jgi:hypothetical protein
VSGANPLPPHRGWGTRLASNVLHELEVQTSRTMSPFDVRLQRDWRCDPVLQRILCQRRRSCGRRDGSGRRGRCMLVQPSQLHA